MSFVKNFRKENKVERFWRFVFDVQNLSRWGGIDVVQFFYLFKWIQFVEVELKFVDDFSKASFSISAKRFGRTNQRFYLKRPFLNLEIILCKKHCQTKFLGIEFPNAKFIIRNFYKQVCNLKSTCDKCYGHKRSINLSKLWTFEIKSLFSWGLYHCPFIHFDKWGIIDESLR